MDRATCKYYNGDYHNPRCLAGVAYVDVTPEPMKIDGIAFRKPCIDWPEWNKIHNTQWDTPAQRANYERHGVCEKRELPTDEEISEDNERHEARISEVLVSLEKGIGPDGVIVCGPSTVGKCKCNCPANCEHLWDGKPLTEEEDGIESSTCSLCGMSSFSHDLWVGE